MFVSLTLKHLLNVCGKRQPQYFICKSHFECCIKYVNNGAEEIIRDQNDKFAILNCQEGMHLMLGLSHLASRQITDLIPKFYSPKRSLLLRREPGSIGYVRRLIIKGCKFKFCTVS